MGKYKKPAHLCCEPRCRNPRKKDRKRCSKHHQQRFKEKHPERYAYANLRGRANQKKVPFTLTFLQFTQLPGFAQWMELKGTARGALHLDRINACLGYELGNVRVLAQSENIAKGNRERHCTDYVRTLMERRRQQGKEVHIPQELIPF